MMTKDVFTLHRIVCRVKMSSSRDKTGFCDFGIVQWGLIFLVINFVFMIITLKYYSKFVNYEIFY